MLPSTPSLSFGKYFLASLLGLASVMLGGCHSSTVASKPALQITQVPAANPGGPVQMDFIEGRVTGAKPGQQIVLYAYSGIWWIQPFAGHQFTNIQPDATWRNSTHLGTKYAAILVGPNYRPPTKVVDLPSEGKGVLAVATADGRSDAPIVSKVLHFSGYDWTVQAAASDRGGKPNVYDTRNAWVDNDGYLHLRMQEHDGVWTCAEVSLNRSLGYGSYIYVVRDVSQLKPSDVLGMYTADDFRLDNVRSELDVEMSRWGLASSKNAQYVVQPFYIPENLSRFIVPAGVLTTIVNWQPGHATFKTFRGAPSHVGGAVVSEHAFTSSIPTAAKEKVHIGLYSYIRSKDSPQQPVEVVLEKFEFLP
jgi:hypothetical protein